MGGPGGPATPPSWRDDLKVLDMETFDSAPVVLAQIVAAHSSPEKCRGGIVVRDVFGRLSFVATTLSKTQIDSITTQAHSSLLGFVDPGSNVVLALQPKSPMWLGLNSEPAIHLSFSADSLDKVKLIDRRLAGEEWLLRPKPLIEAGPKRLIFYSLKGGVGRSTALCVTAADLAESGLNVLVVDLDLEAPGLRSLLLSEDRVPKFGVIDWFAAAAAGCDTSVLEAQMVASSNFTSPRAVVSVVPAAGKSSNPTPGSYLAKLARAYTPGSAGNMFAEKGFAEKLNVMIERIVGLRKYDVILIDARAGLHETSGSILLGLGAQALLFGIETTQTFDDYNILLSMFADIFAPDSGNPDLRGAFKMVHAKAPAKPEDRATFINESWNLWSEYLYDEGDANAGSDAFTFDFLDPNGPHFPLEIIGDPQFNRFDPRIAAYQLDQKTYASAFSDFLAGVRLKLELS